MAASAAPAAAVGTASAATYKVDEYHANARFAIDHFNTSTNVGGFYGLTGSVEFDQAKRDGKIYITIPVANLQSGSQHFTDPWILSMGLLFWLSVGTEILDFTMLVFGGEWFFGW
ncbi:YceI family protein, partial [Neisseria meningitidis]|uniref:YceI family protein n=1 Tax=Neisseria meningitidis TaxID=487 RepID=UPI003CC66095